MSTMALKLPQNYAEVEKEEMMYVNGGLSISKTWYGYYIVLSARNCGDLAALSAGGSVSSAAVAGVLGLTGVGIPVAIGLTIGAGILGVGSAYMWLCSNHNGATMRVIAGQATPPVIRW